MRIFKYTILKNQTSSIKNTLKPSKQQVKGISVNLFIFLDDKDQACLLKLSI
ncbi:hypothetical protein FD20_GL000303 [Liquorilactobacillus uvarum DSM 19971]|uniref:Uncharacterized protein n=1 Tax=Liquorilactobacillus uvarum DSM 19971 TaxID=1423812 RepID=A0A0R1Q5P1_9LACO|nr:hypothetical protein FD20_GL000303 [Liquorilactobacillus uvarum DSM 19971]